MIRFDRVSVARAGVVVVRDVELTLEGGHAAAVVGRSGSGRSSLLAAVATAIPIHGGDLLVDGHSVRSAGAAVRRLIGYAPARIPTWPSVRADEFLELFAASAGLRGKPLRSAIDAALEMAGLAGRGHVPIDTLSDGHGRRLVLARALLHGPRVLVLDDPFAGLDPTERTEVERLIGDATIMGRTVLAAIDDCRVPACFSRIVVLDEGRLAAWGPADPGHHEGRVGPWRHRITCPGRAEAAAAVLAPLAGAVQAVDEHVVECVADPARLPFPELVAAVVRAGIAVEAAGHHPHWAAQLVARLS
jgi:ABC-2 type transport system ATP-binding protein